MTIGICNDHAGVALKKAISALLEDMGHTVVDYGTDTTQSVDYPDFAHLLAKGILSGECEAGIAICGTGNGMAITLNHHSDIRAGLAWSPEVAALVKGHNNANVLVLSARFVSQTDNLESVKAWLNASFEGGRHLSRIEKIE